MAGSSVGGPSGEGGESLFTRAIRTAVEMEGATGGRAILLDHKVAGIAGEVLGGGAPVSQEPAVRMLAAELAGRLSVPEGSEDCAHIVAAARCYLSARGEADRELEVAYAVPEAPTTLAAREVDDLREVGSEKMGPYTCLEHSLRSPAQLLAMHQVSRKPIRDLIPLNLERAVMHEFAVRCMFSYALRPGESLDAFLVEVVPQIQAHFFNGHETELAALLAQRGKDEAAFKSALDIEVQLEEGTREYIDAAKGELRETESEEAKAYIAARAADLLYRQRIHALVSREDLTQYDAVVGRAPLPPQTDATRHLYMMNGGISSGKGTAEREVKAAAEREGVDWAHVLTINADAYKPLCMRPGTLSEEMALYYTGFTYDEACMLRSDVLAEYSRRLEEGTAPHLYLDRTVPTPSNFDLGKRNENPTQLFFVSLPVEKSVPLAYLRGKKTGRYEATQNIFNTHVNSVLALKNLLISMKTAHASVQAHLVANVSPTEVVPIADVDCRAGTLVERDHTLALSLFKKVAINVEARNEAEVYPDETAAETAAQRALGELEAAFVLGEVE